MRLAELRVHNFRSIRDSGATKICSLQAFIGENNSGKSNVLQAIDCLTSAGTAGISVSDFNDRKDRIVIQGTFVDLSGAETAVWRSYMVAGKLILEKQIWIESDERTGKEQVKAEFHGYQAEPTAWHLSLLKIEEKYGARPKWAEIVAECGLPDYFLKDGKCNKSIYTEALSQFLSENEVSFDEPDLSQTQALGLQSRVVATLPATYLLKAITDYSAEIDRRSSTTTFRRLMGDLSNRALQSDPRYPEIQEALDKISNLLNGDRAESGISRLELMPIIEERITALIQKLMPSVSRVRMRVETEPVHDLFSRGVQLRIDDGVDTEVIAKGHGLQRCIVFTLLQALIMNERQSLLGPNSQSTSITEPSNPPTNHRSIILLVEEPELYIHPQLCKLFFDAMQEFSGKDQVIYTTHSPLFVDAYEYNSICLIKKANPQEGTRSRNCDSSAFDGLTEKKIFRGLTRLNPSANELFFAKRVLLVEGPEDQIAVIATLKAEGLIRHHIEEIDITIVVAGGKSSIPFFQRILNAFNIPYSVLHDHDVVEAMNPDVRAIEEIRNQEIAALAGTQPVIRFPHKLETTLGLAKDHLKDQFEAYRYFDVEANITPALRHLVRESVGKSIPENSPEATSQLPVPSGA